jgi:hypothetical protein
LIESFFFLFLLLFSFVSLLLSLSLFRSALEIVTKKEADDYFVFLVSDANLRRYGIAPEALGSFPLPSFFCPFSLLLFILSHLLSFILPFFFPIFLLSFSESSDKGRSRQHLCNLHRLPL